MAWGFRLDAFGFPQNPEKGYSDTPPKLVLVLASFLGGRRFPPDPLGRDTRPNNLPGLGGLERQPKILKPKAGSSTSAGIWYAVRRTSTGCGLNFFLVLWGKLLLSETFRGARA